MFLLPTNLYFVFSSTTTSMTESLLMCHQGLSELLKNENSHDRNTLQSDFLSTQVSSSPSITGADRYSIWKKPTCPGPETAFALHALECPSQSDDLPYRTATSNRSICCRKHSHSQDIICDVRRLPARGFSPATCSKHGLYQEFWSKHLHPKETAV
jgi:hypothetical protein